MGSKLVLSLKVALANSLVVIISTIFLTSCSTPSNLKQTKDFVNTVWVSDSIVIFNIKVEAPGNYKVLYNARLSNTTYPFNNLYIKYAVTKAFGPKPEVLVSDLQQFATSDAVTGEPIGSGIGDMRDVPFIANKRLVLKEAGTYQIRLQQYMRVKELLGISAISIVLEKE